MKNTSDPKLVQKHDNTDLTDLLNKCQQKVNAATKNHKIFTIYGEYKTIRDALKRRGWIEKFSPNYLPCLHVLPLNTLLKYAATDNSDNRYEAMAMSKLTKSHPVKFLWLPKTVTYYKNRFLYPHHNHIKMLNNLDFTTKDGLVECIDRKHWNTISGLSEVKHPRIQRLTNLEEYCQFFKNYQITYCLSLLQFTYESKDNDKLFHEFGTIPLSIIYDAIQKIHQEIEFIENGDIDKVCSSSTNLDNTIEWNKFTKNVDRFTKLNIPIRSDKKQILEFYTALNTLMSKIQIYWPSLYSEGYNNLWIIKPARSSRGIGIVIKANYNEIINFVKDNKNKNYIVQKYVERPLLIYDTKFDIRQYMLVTISKRTINIWVYQNCYLRFCSQRYDLNNLDNSIHLTNFSIQKNFTNSYDNSKLPDENMWSLEEFQKYLIEKGKPHIWKQKIYPGMVKNMIAIILSGVEEMLLKPNLFELYGCDFMLDENYEPMLIEINSQPDMSPSTKITKRICPATLEDLIRVVVDLQEHPRSSTGKFQLEHSFKYMAPQVTDPDEIQVIGKKVKIK